MEEHRTKEERTEWSGAEHSGTLTKPRAGKGEEAHVTGGACLLLERKKHMVKNGSGVVVPSGANHKVMNTSKTATSSCAQSTRYLNTRIN